MEQRELELIKNDMKIIITNKLNSSQSKLLLIGIIFEILQRRDLFPRNSDLKKFTQEVFVEPFEEIDPIKEYVFLSRTLLGSRINLIILNYFEYHNVINTVKKLSELLPNGVKKEGRHSKNSDDEMVEWINYIRGNKE